MPVLFYRTCRSTLSSLALIKAFNWLIYSARKPIHDLTVEAGISGLWGHSGGSDGGFFTSYMWCLLQCPGWWRSSIFYYAHASRSFTFQAFFCPFAHPLVFPPSSLCFPIAVHLLRPAALDSDSSDPLNLLSPDLLTVIYCSTNQYVPASLCPHVIWCKIMQPCESPWITANKWASVQTGG